MKYLNLSTILLVIPLYSLSQIDIKTPTGVDIYYEVDNTIMDAGERAACWAYYDSMINVNGWNADIKANGSYKYNCHAYAWHMSDGGDTVRIPNVSDVEKYFSGDRATYEEVDHMNYYSKIYYNGAAHSARADTADLSYVWSKWGSAVLVRHAPNHCPYENYSKEYYDLIIDDSPNSVAKGCATDVTTLDINNNWSGIKV
ncbi:hypothetical protein [Maribellus maritimus]|uniref:hypothetical protein n=1 Tax=Maribellus maritimus TaxID=2870838 RepID=UPI001EEC27E2|nr:hypothetical protein [Maribellus maritimus]MCG6187622.1 hypothetical protein [Maribellus maritimus]